MSERLFLLELKMELRGLPEQTIEEIVDEYKVYFQEAKSEGLTDSEIIERLGGNSTNLAQSIKEKVNASTIEEGHRPSKGQSVLITIGLILFNLIIVIGPFFGLVGAGVALLVAFGVSLISPLLVLLSFALQGGHILELMVSFVLFGVSLIIYPAVTSGINIAVQGIKSYVNWNKRVINEGRL